MTWQTELLFAVWLNCQGNFAACVSSEEGRNTALLLYVDATALLSPVMRVRERCVDPACQSTVSDD